ncbi:tyrosine-protein phosphatase [Lacticaseibacillus suihuaensis]
MQATALPLQQAANCRDLGGYQTQDGRLLRYHKLLRSGRLDQLSAADCQSLRDYGVVYDVDLRSPEERAKAPDRVPAGVTYVFDPVLPVDQTAAAKQADQLRRSQFAVDPQAGRRHMIALYRDLPRHASAQKAYRRLFDLLLANNQPGQALLFHCTSGKDRTGLGAVLVLTALGVDSAMIRADYLAANRFLTATTAALLATVRAAGGSQALEASTRSLASVDAAYLDAALATIAQDFGGLERYLLEGLGLTAAKRRTLQALYLE